MSWIIAHWEELALGALAAVGGLWALAKAIAPLTDSKLDDKIAGILGKVHRAIKALLGLK